MAKAQSQVVSIAPPQIGVAKFKIRGTAPLVMHKFSEKVRQMLKERHEAGSQSKTKKAKAARDFDAEFLAAAHRFEDGGYGIPCSAFRAALISACRLVGFTMTRAKLSLFIEADGYEDGLGLVRITKGVPTPKLMEVRNETGVVDLRMRPMWAPGWEAVVTLRFDLGQFSTADVANLLARVGLQVGLLEGRPDSKNSAGMGWGLFEIVSKDQAK